MYTSKFTSINKYRPAKIYKELIGADCLKGKDVLDYGCGRYIDPIRAVHENGNARSSMFYDKFWKPQNLMFRSFDVIVCANVLNVIQNDQDYEAAIVDMYQMLAPLGSIYIQIYEGDKSGAGRQTGVDSWQRNEKTSIHLDRIRNILNSHFATGWQLRMWHGYIVIDE